MVEDDTLIVKKADKGSGVVLENKDNHVKDGLDHLSYANMYEETESDPTLPLAENINKYVHHMYSKGIIDNTTKEYLSFKRDKEPRTQQLYFLKKMHKNPITVRPIVSECGGSTEKIFEFLDFHLQPRVPKIKSYIQDSGDLITLLESKTIMTNCVLATTDVKALYPNIPHTDGINAIMDRLYYTSPNSEDVKLLPNTTADLLKIVLIQNYFQFANKTFHQVQGTATGTKMAHAYANLFMAELDEYILQDYLTEPILWKRYIDNILCIWPGTQDSLKKIIEYLNRHHPTIKFTYECSPTEIQFLEVTIHKGDRYKSIG